MTPDEPGRAEGLECDEPGHLPIRWFRDRIEEQTQRAGQANLDRAWDKTEHHQALVHAANVMAMLEHFGTGIVGHLIDTDDNEGEYLRRRLRNLGIEANWRPSR